MERAETRARRAPQDGIVASQRPRGWLAERWTAQLRALGPIHGGRLARGRAYARGGRARNLWFSPGLASAELVTSGTHQVSLRFRVLDDDEWDRVLSVLSGRLEFVAALLEGELPRVFVNVVRSESGIDLVPRMDELDGDCDCSDYLLPCAHMAALLTLLADALDGEPFLLLTLRGWTREHLMAQLRRSWGDSAPLLPVTIRAEVEPPETDWYTATAVEPMAFSFQPPTDHALGLRALGPPPGQIDLLRSLEPLYQAGSTAGFEIAHRELQLPRPNPPRRPPEPLEGPVPPHEDDGITEHVVDLLARLESAASHQIARELAVPPNRVRRELLELERLGIVVRPNAEQPEEWCLG